MPYVPLSIHMPSYVKELQATQVQQAKSKTWFPCTRQQQIVVLGPCGTKEPPTVNLQEELSAAIEELLESKPQPSTHNRGATIKSIVKTSETHPIKYVLHICFMLQSEHGFSTQHFENNPSGSTGHNILPHFTFQKSQHFPCLI